MKLIKQAIFVIPLLLLVIAAILISCIKDGALYTLRLMHAEFKSICKILDFKKVVTGLIGFSILVILAFVVSKLI